MGRLSVRAQPKWHDLFGVRVCPTSYDHLVTLLCDAAARGDRGIVDFMPVHGLVTAAMDRRFRARMNRFDIVAPDGQPVRWALNRFHRAGLDDRVYGPELMQRLCNAAADEGHAIYLYGSTPEVIETLRARLRERHPDLRIAGAESPPFRPLTADEDADVVRRINASGARFVFVGTGCPRQEHFAFDHRHSIDAIQLCVGAAFDLIAGTRSMAPAWMQRRGLEWLYRLVQEPRRLMRRYLVTNTLFTYFVVRRMLLGAPSPGPAS